MNVGADGMARILVLDDEPAVVEGIERVLMDRFDVTGATAGSAALVLLRNNGPFDAVLSDMRMPEMDGATFLAAAARDAPDTVRILLTGQTDVDSAVAAVNQGRIFRFLRKPCSAPDLERALDDAVQQRRVMLAERLLLEQTLRGAVSALSQVLQLVAPSAFRRDAAILRYVRHVVEKCHLQPAWAFETAAMLAHIGCVALPGDLVDQAAAGASMNARDRATYLQHANTAHALLVAIPRLEDVAEMIRLHVAPDLDPDVPTHVREGAALLRVAVGIDEGVRRGEGVVPALARMRHNATVIERKFLDALADMRVVADAPERRAVNLAQLRLGMVLDEDVVSSTGAVIVRRGTDVTPLLRERLRTFADRTGLREPFFVRYEP